MTGFHLKHFRLKQVMEQNVVTFCQKHGDTHTHQKQNKKHEPCQIYLPSEQSKFPVFTEKYKITCQKGVRINNNKLKVLCLP